MPCNVRQGCHSDLRPLSNAVARTWQGEIGSQDSLREQGPSHLHSPEACRTGSKVSSLKDTEDNRALTYLLALRLTPKEEKKKTV